MTLCALLGGLACTLMDFFLTIDRLDCSTWFFYSEVFYGSVALWPAADGKASSPQVCITKQTGQRSGLATWE